MVKSQDNNIFIKSNINTIRKRIYFLILLAIAFSGGLIENQMVITENIEMQNLLTMIFTIFSISTMIIIIISLIIYCISKGYLENVSGLLEKQVTEQIEHYNKIDKLNNNLREFRHDYKNHMACLQALLEHNEYEDARQYIYEITNQEILEANSIFTGSKIADIILSDKKDKAKPANIIIDFAGEISDKISASDLCTILANALDNAIEACRKISGSEPKTITVKCAFIHNVQVIQISNPIAKKVDIINNTADTSKEDTSKHGFGLYNIKKTVNKYKGDFEIKSDADTLK
jgi:sensor histidine kinase regulating citrate/malate metabolism